MDKQTKINCQICKTKYTVFITEHICKRCLRSICKDCASNKKIIYTKTNMKGQQHRVCNICKSQSEQIGSYIKTNTISFGNMSQVGKQWLQIIYADIPPNKNKNQSKNSLTLQDISQIYTNMTHSYRQFIGISLNKSNNIQSDLQKIFNQNKDNSIDKHNINSFNLLLLYICCHCHQVGSGKVIQYILPILSSFNIDNVIKKLKLLQQMQNKDLINYAKNSWISFIYSFGLNVLQINVVGHIFFQTLLSGSIQPLQNSFTFLISNNKNIILNLIDESKVKLLIGRNTNIKNVEKGIKMIRKLIIKQDKIKNSKKIIQEEEKNQKQLKQQRIQQVQQQQQQQQQEQKIKNYDKVNQKIDLAQKYLNQIQQSSNKKPTIQQMENMDQFLDLIISQNNAQLQEIDKFDHLLDNIMKQLHNTQK